MPITALFWIATVFVIIAQVMILRSTVRAMRGSSSESARRGIEWGYAIVPVIALVMVLLATWQATERRQVEVQVTGEAAP